MFSRTTISSYSSYLDVTATGSSIEFSQIWRPWVVQVGHSSLVHLGSLCYLSWPQLIPSGLCSITWESLLPFLVVLGYHLNFSLFFSTRVLFAICPTNAIRAGMSTIFFVFTAFSIFSSTGIKSAKNHLQTYHSIKVWVLQCVDKDLDHLFFIQGKACSSCHFSPLLGILPKGFAALLLHSLQVKAVWCYL